jgi:hypothetical protein
MKVVGILTEDPRAYFDLLTALRAEGLKPLSLDFSEPLPANIAVVVTTEAERGRVPFDRVVTDPDPGVAVARVKNLLTGGREPTNIIIGIDPGTRPGIAAVARDGAPLVRAQAPSPEGVREKVDEIAQRYSSSGMVIRIGNGDRTNRNRIFNMLWDRGYRVEIVDERNTTKRSKTPDEDAAYEIALTPGYAPRERQEVSPQPGEIRNIQRLSRLHSDGTLTVSRELAERVALGELSMEEAIARQKGLGQDGR